MHCLHQCHLTKFSTVPFTRMENQVIATCNYILSALPVVCICVAMYEHLCKLIRLMKNTKDYLKRTKSCQPTVVVYYLVNSLIPCNA